MAAPLLVAQLSTFSAEGHGEYRVHGPGRGLARLPGVTVVDCDPDHRWADWLAEHADVLVLHGTSPDYPPLAARRRVAGRVTTFEAADDYFDLQPWSEYSVGWLDRGKRGQFWALVAAADAVQTSTPALAELWKPVARRVCVFPNRLAAVPPLPPPPDRPLTVGWAGSGTHLPDWFALAPVLERWVAGHPTARLAVMTDAAARPFVRLPADRYAFRPPGSLADYGRFLRELDVGVVPLLPAPFNRGRTDLKFVEFAANGVVGLYEAEGPYPTSVEPGRTGFLFRTPGELIAHLDRLAADPALRRAVRNRAHAEVARRHADGGYEPRLAVYRALLDAPPRNPPLPPELIRDATADGRYFALPPGEPERVVRWASGAVGANSPDPSAAREVGEVVRRFPGYAVAHRTAARCAVAAGNFADATAHLDAVLASGPESPATMTEAAGVFLAGRDAESARPLLERAVALNPAYSPAWSLLVRAADPDDIGAWADRAAANQPDHYLAALATLKGLPPGEQRTRLAEYLDRFAVGLAPDERPFVAAAFGRVLAEVVAAARDPGDADLLAKACEAFPESARLAAAHADVRYASGDADGAAAEYARAAGIARVARGFQLEYPAPPTDQRVWAVAEYYRRHRPVRGAEGGNA